VIDYNGKDPERFYHKTQLLLREEGYINFTAYETKTKGHLHLYIQIEETPIEEAFYTGKSLSDKLVTHLPKEWRVFPTLDLPKAYNILILPTGLYKENP